MSTQPNKLDDTAFLDRALSLNIKVTNILTL